MKKVLLPALLATSLVANVYLLLRPRPTVIGSSNAHPAQAREATPSDSPAAKGASTPTAHAPDADARATALLSRWTPDYSTASLRRLADDLRAAGLPQHAVRAAIEALISRHLRAESDFAKAAVLATGLRWQALRGGS